MTTRRTFLVNVIGLAGLSIAPRHFLVLDDLSSAASGAPADDDFDFDGYYVAVSREADGSVVLSELINNNLKARATFAIDDLQGIEQFIEEAGLAKIRFIDWNAAPSEGTIPVHEVEIDWRDGKLPASLALAFRECADLLSCAPHDGIA